MSAGRWDTALYGAALLEIDAARARSKTREAFVEALRALLAQARTDHDERSAQARECVARAGAEGVGPALAARLLRESSFAVALAAQAEQLAYAVTDALVAEGEEFVVRETIGGAA